MYQDGQFSKCSQKWKFTSISPPPAWSKGIDENRPGNKEIQPNFQTRSSQQHGIFWLAEVCQVQDKVFFYHLWCHFTFTIFGAFVIMSLKPTFAVKVTYKLPRCWGTKFSP